MLAIGVLTSIYINLDEIKKVIVCIPPHIQELTVFRSLF